MKERQSGKVQPDAIVIEGDVVWLCSNLKALKREDMTKQRQWPLIHEELKLVFMVKAEEVEVW